MIRESNFKFLILALSLVSAPICAAVEDQQVAQSKVSKVEKVTGFVKNHSMACTVAAMYLVLAWTPVGRTQVVRPYTYPWLCWLASSAVLKVNNFNNLSIARTVGLFGIASMLIGSYEILNEAYKLAKMGIEKVKQQKVSHE